MKATYWVSVLALAAACGGDEENTDSAAQAISTVQMSDATTGGTADFYFLTPTAPSDPTTFSGPYNGTFASRLKVDVVNEDCATFTPTTVAYEFTTVTATKTISAYRASNTLAGMGLVNHNCYRVTPLLDNAPLGYRDVKYESTNNNTPPGVLRWSGTGNIIISFTLRNSVDTDGDGVLNHVDQCPTAAGPSSNNGCPIIDNCPSDPNKTDPGHCGCGNPDVDADLDGNYAGDGSYSPGCSDLCDTDANKSAPGQCGCGAADVDADGDGNYAGSGSVPGCTDQCDNNPLKSAPGTCGCDGYLVDFNEDGSGDACSNPNSCTFGP